MQRILALSIPFALVAGCVAPPRPEPQAPPPPRPVPASSRPVPAPPPAGSDWRDWALTPGTWSYTRDARGSIALFGRPGADAELTLRCDLQARALFLSRRGAAPANVPMTIRTNSATRALTMAPTGGMPAYMAVRLPPRDAMIDAMGFSRGRFVVEMLPMPVLVVPAWAEILRVAEDCRG